MPRLFLMLFLVGLASVASAAMDIPVEARESHLKFKDGSDLLVRSDGRHLVSIEFQFRGAKHSIKGKILEGVERPDLTSLKLKMVAIDQCEPASDPCPVYSIPLIEISVGGIPEDQECLEQCVVGFLLRGDYVYRRTSSRKGGMTTKHTQQSFSIIRD